jgi:hypothetical protein
MNLTSIYYNLASVGIETITESSGVNGIYTTTVPAWKIWAERGRFERRSLVGKFIDEVIFFRWLYILHTAALVSN